LTKLRCSTQTVPFLAHPVVSNFRDAVCRSV